MMCSRNLLGDGFFDLLASGMVGESGVRVGHVLVGHQSALVGDGLESVGRVGDGDFRILAAKVPAQLLNEQGAQVELL